MKTAEVLQFLFEHIKGLHIENCDCYINRPTFFGNKEGRSDTYVIVSLPNGIDDLSAFEHSVGMITIGSKDKIAGLPNVGDIERVTEIIKDSFPVLTDELSMLDFEFTSDDSDGREWHEFYYSFQLYINN